MSVTTKIEKKKKEIAGDGGVRSSWQRLDLVLVVLADCFGVTAMMEAAFTRYSESDFISLKAQKVKCTCSLVDFTDLFDYIKSTSIPDGLIGPRAAVQKKSVESKSKTSNVSPRSQTLAVI